MEYVKVKPCRIEGCGRPCWDGGDICPRCMEEMESVPLTEAKDWRYVTSTLLVCVLIFCGVWLWLWLAGAR